MNLAHQSGSIRKALIGLLVVAAISVAAASGRKPIAESPAATMRMLTDAEVAQVCQRFPDLGSQISQLRSELLNHLFPNAHFYKAFSHATAPPIPYLYAADGDSLLAMPDGFNWLLRRHHYGVSDKNMVELAKALAILATASEPVVNQREMGPGRLDSLPRITFLDATRAKMEEWVTDAVQLKMGIGEQAEEWHFYVLRNQFEGVSAVNEQGLIKDYQITEARSRPGRGQSNPTRGSALREKLSEEVTVSLRLITVSEMMDFLHKFPEMLSGYSASERNDTGYLGQAFRFTDVTAAPLEHAFPAARFYRGIDFETSDAQSPYLMAVAGDKRYAMPGEFNRLLVDNDLKVTDTNAVELAEALVIAYIGNWYQSFPEITFLDASLTKQRMGGITFDVSLKVQVGDQVEEWQLGVMRGQFEAVVSHDASGKTIDFCLLGMVDSLSRRGQPS